jgi:SAM-dependent methyltransferase
MTAESSRERRSEVWTRYWRTGALHSCGTSWDGNYGGAIRHHWQAVAGSLGPAVRVLDIATGNGAVPRLLAESAVAEGLVIDAVDLAEIEPAWALDRRNAAQAIRFHARTSVEALPFDDGTFDLATSQYGIEYADIGRAGAEVARVLRAGGRLSAIVHHAEGVVAQVSREELRHIAWLLAPDGLLDAADVIAGPLAQAATPAGRAALIRDPAAGAARACFNALQDEAEARIAAAAVPDLVHEARQAIAHALQPAIAQGRADRAREALAAYRTSVAEIALRLRELVDRAWDEAACRDHLQTLHAAGLVLTAEPLRDEGRLLGWRVSGRKKGEA